VRTSNPTTLSIFDENKKRNMRKRKIKGTEKKKKLRCRKENKKMNLVPLYAITAFIFVVRPSPFKNLVVSNRKENDISEKLYNRNAICRHIFVTPEHDP
jgi:hypothetical protein